MSNRGSGLCFLIDIRRLQFLLTSSVVLRFAAGLVLVVSLIFESCEQPLIAHSRRNQDSHVRNGLPSQR